MGVAHILSPGGPLAERLGEAIRLKYVVDVRLDQIERALTLPDEVILTANLDDPLRDAEVDVVVELIGGTTVAGNLIEQALEAGKDVVTANKALLAERGDALFRLARSNGRCIAFEAAVAGGIPVIAAIRSGLVADRIDSVYGIVNGTCNYILTRMLENGISYEDALKEAQEHGYAEADPALDVGGHDSAHKLAVLTRTAFGVNVRLQDIPCEGIAGVDLSDIQEANALGYALKLLAVAVRQEDRLDLRVHPALLRRDHPLAAVGGVFNAVSVHGDQVGDVVLTGRGAGRTPTASAVVSDVARIALGKYQADFAGMAVFGEVPAAKLVPRGEARLRYYLRFAVRDQPGALAQFAAILGRHKISIASVHQKEAPGLGGDFVPVIVMTHLAKEKAVQDAVTEIGRLDVVSADGTRLLRVEDV